MTNKVLTGILLRLRVLLALLFTYPFLSYAAYLNLQDSTIAIEQVKIGAKRERELLYPFDIKEREIRRSTAQNVAEALRLLAGVQVKDYGGIGGLKTVNVRSLGSQHVAISYDGVLVGNAQNGIVDLGRFSIDNIEQISLLHTAPDSSLLSARDYLSGALVRLQPRRPRVNKTNPFRLSTTFRTGSYGLINPQIHYEQRLSNKLALSLNTAIVEAHGRYKFRYTGYNTLGEKVYDTTAIRRNGDVHLQRMEMALYRLINDGGLRLRFYGYHAERGLPGPIVNNVWRRGERLEDQNFFAQANCQKQLTPFYSTIFLAKYAFDKTHYRQLDSRFYAANLIYLQHEVYFSTGHKLRFTPWLDLSLAYDFLWNRLNSQDRLRLRPPLLVPSRTTHYGVLALLVHLRSFRLRLASVATAALHRKQTTANGFLCPELSLAYVLPRFPSLSWHGAWKQTLRYPTFNELYYLDWGNAILKPELTTQRMIGAQWQYHSRKTALKAVTLLIDAYSNTIYNKIIAYPTRGQFHWTTLNLGRVAMYGIESSLLLQGNFWKLNDFAIRLQYAYTQARDLTDPKAIYYKHQIPYTPWHSGACVLSYQWRNYAIYYSFIYTGERYHLRENNPFNYEPAWYTNDVAIALNFSIFTHALLVRLEVNNLLDQQYAVVLNYPMPGRNFRLTGQISFR